jgi:predicted DNA-binding protein
MTTTTVRRKSKLLGVRVKLSTYRRLQALAEQLGTTPTTIARRAVIRASKQAKAVRVNNRG